VPGWATPATCSSSPPRISEDNLAAERRTPAAGDAIHAGISSRDPIVTMLTGSTSKGQRLRGGCEGTETGRWQATRSAHGRESELLSAKGEVKYGVALVTAAKAEALVSAGPESP
jgi:hypothetical protein